MPTLHIQLLGDFRVVYEGKPVAGIASPRLQSLLAFLVLHRDTQLSRKYLACLLWQDSSEAQAHSNVRNLLHRLRGCCPTPNVLWLPMRKRCGGGPMRPWHSMLTSLSKDGVCRHRGTGDNFAAPSF
jgi:DNA-binding SARP family transcriptional activator